MAKEIKKNAPGWLGLSVDRTEFVLIAERAEIVREIFYLNTGGLGGRIIAQLLNARKVPTFGSSREWDQSAIQNIISNRATFGEYQKRQNVGGKKRAVGQPVPNYYPAVISYSDFAAAEDARRYNIRSRSGRRGKDLANLFFGVRLTCFYCRRQIKFYSKSSGNCVVCSAVLQGDTTCPRFAWSYHDFERTFFRCLDGTQRYSDVSERMVELRRVAELSQEGAVLEARMYIASNLRLLLKEVVIASAGAEAPTPKKHRLIRRDHPSRFFQATFRDGCSIKGIPKESEPSGVKIEPKILEKSLSLSPRQAQLTSLLVQGFTLNQVAAQLSQTRETARWHLREIFRRTYTHSQAELTSLVERLALK
jgi:DNA-binding CsgD family transcriptional regulator